MNLAEFYLGDFSSDHPINLIAWPLSCTKSKRGFASRNWNASSAWRFLDNPPQLQIVDDKYQAQVKKILIMRLRSIND
jgi:hypothetical protein